jgi:predicted nucleotidyltransferase
MNDIEQAIIKLDDKLKGISFDFAFLGGSLLTLLITDKSADAIRVTKDVDIMMNIRTRNEYHAADSELEKRGFKHDTSEGAPICRWILDDLTVDVLPIREDVLGWKSKWFEEALSCAKTIPIENRSIRVVLPPYFIALKLEAFEERGKKDFITSTDFEDVICVFNGRPSILEEILACNELLDYLSSKFKDYLTYAELEDAIEGF